ncbi:carbohydrate kinase family protein [Actinoplanes aureus]|uniref:Carbohydrate kinase family protein n=1 Tax=Actinoplanes aureus TaxID=2792083 RepID=A0A931C5J0_9ACTN|nr:carbohydrate kinase family protein [Actinoplanes aureus]MBG0563795.1 carbohydrate kinase family protein [Actinoplanes aureus]
MTFDLLVVGDANPDAVLSGAPADLPWGQRERLVAGGALTLGGSAAITACGAARLGLRTAFAGRVGDDPAGRFCLDALRERGVDVTGCVVDPSVATALTVVLAGGDDRAILTAPGCLPLLRIGDIGPVSARHVHVSSYFLQPRLAAGLPAWFAGLRDRGITTSLDTNDDPSGRWDSGVADAIARTDIFLPNEAEALALTRTDDVLAAAEALAASGGLVVVKRGAGGALAWADGGPITVPGRPATPVDTVGAGDSFNAGFLAGHLGGADLTTSLRLAAACGALSTRAAGGTAAQPTMTEIGTETSTA